MKDMSSVEFYMTRLCLSTMKLTTSNEVHQMRLQSWLAIFSNWSYLVASEVVSMMSTSLQLCSSSFAPSMPLNFSACRVNMAQKSLSSAIFWQAALLSAVWQRASALRMKTSLETRAALVDATLALRSGAFETSAFFWTGAGEASELVNGQNFWSTFDPRNSWRASA